MIDPVSRRKILEGFAGLTAIVAAGGAQAKTARAELEKLSPWLDELNRRDARNLQSHCGWYDDDGVRQGGLIAFVRYFWKVLEPETQFVDGWPLWAMCEHLEAVTEGKITRLLINVPPGSMKSLLVDVFWPAWEWGPMGLDHLRYVSFSYSASLTERDNGRFRHLITSEGFRKLYPKHALVDNKTIIKVQNSKRGFKFASSVGGVGTGERGDRVILDDPHNVVDIESEQIRTETVRWFRESMSSRLNDLETGAIVIIMQRVHEADVSGTILDGDFEYDHLMIPMEYDSGRQVMADGSPVTTSIGWYDPRYDEDQPHEANGEPAWPDRFPPQAMARTRQEIGPYAWAAQYQQSPAPRGGGIFQREWWQLWDDPTGKFPELDYVIASLDGAFTEKEENHPSALTVWGTFRHEGKKRIILINAWRKFLKFSAPIEPRRPQESYAAYRQRTMPNWGLLEWVSDSCRRFKVDLLLIEAKGPGISAAHELRNRYGLEGWGIMEMPVKGDKVARAYAAQPTFAQGIVYAPDRDWADMVMSEMETFPKARYDDLTDSTTQAINYLRGVGLAQSDEEAFAAEIEGVRHKPRPKPLYPV